MSIRLLGSVSLCLGYIQFIQIKPNMFLHSLAHETSYPVYKYISLGNWVQKQAENCVIFSELGYLPGGKFGGRSGGQSGLLVRTGPVL